MSHQEKDQAWSMERKAERFAELYLLEYGCNTRDAYRQLRREVNPEDETKECTIRTQCYRFKNNPKVLKAIETLRAEIASEGQVRRDEIIMALREMAYPAQDSGVTAKTQLQALDMLNKMGGYYTENHNLNAQMDIDIVIE